MQSTAKSADKPLGVIDALRNGFTLINRHLWLLIIPVLVDLLLWFSPRFSLAPLVEQSLDSLFAQPDLPTEFSENATLGMETLRIMAGNYDLLSLVSGSLAGVPSYLARLDAAAAIKASTVIAFDNIFQVLLYAFGFTLAGLLIGSMWLALMVRSLDSELKGLGDTLRRAGWIWLNSSLYVAGALVLTFAIGGLLIILLTILLLLAGPGGLGLVNFISLMLIWIAIWIGIGLNFVISAIALDGVNVARASWRSLNVVGRNLSSTLGLILIGFILTEGFVRIWLILSANTWGIPIGILGSAYLGAALSAATLYFYRARYQHWQRVRSEVATARRQG